nr:unnamed protein product [Callosobruchus analis]
MCGPQCTSYILIGINVLIIFGGLGDILSGVFGRYGVKGMAERIILIIVGIIELFVAPLGIIATKFRQITMLRAYIVALAVVVLLEIALGTLLVIGGKQIANSMKSSYESSFDNYDKKKADRKEVDWIQNYNECCGIDGPEYWTRRNMSIPYSCWDDDNKIYTKGCSDGIAEYGYNYSIGLAFGEFAAAILKLVAIFLALYLSFVWPNQRPNRYGDL